MFHPNLGSVDLDFELNGRKIEVKCQPIHALLLTKLSEDGTLELAKTASRLQADPEYIANKMSFWIRTSIVLEERD